MYECIWCVCGERGEILNDGKVCFKNKNEKFWVVIFLREKGKREK